MKKMIEQHGKNDQMLEEDSKIKKLVIIQLKVKKGMGHESTAAPLSCSVSFPASGVALSDAEVPEVTLFVGFLVAGMRAAATSRPSSGRRW